jgi:ribosomal protein S18
MPLTTPISALACRAGIDRLLSSLRSAAALLITAALLNGCSLLSIKTPETPLTPREQEARFLTRDYAAHFATVIVRAIDDAADKDHPGGNAQALRLKLAAVTEITRSSTGLSSIGSLMDTWAFALQFRNFVLAAGDDQVPAAAQTELRGDVVQLANEADELGRKVLTQEYPRYHQFVAEYAERNPLGRVDFTRPSILSAWVTDQHDQTPLRSTGTVAQALGDVSDRLRIYGERIPDITLWQAQAALDRAGFDDAGYRDALHNVDAELGRISQLAETSPALAHRAIAELRDGLRTSSERLDQSWLQTLRTLTAERVALADNIASERQSLIEAFNGQRIQLSADADRIVARSLDTSWQQLRKLVREALLLLIVLTLLVLSLPFAAGYFVGRRVRAGDAVK